MARTAILGTGRMGAAMARRLAKQGHDVCLWDRDRSKAEAVGVGTVVGSPAEAARGAELSIVMVTDARAVDAVFRGEDGLLAGAAGRVLANSSTAGPWLLPDLDADVRAAGAQLVDAPVLGSPAQISSGAATLLLGGEAAPVDRAEPVYEAFGTVRRTGAMGTASRLKLIANSMLALAIAGAAELLDAGRSAGLDEETLFAVIAQYAPSVGARRPQFLDGEIDPPLFTARDLVKDLDMSLRQAHEAGVTLPLTAGVRELFGELMRRHPSHDIAGVGERIRAR